jgi:hypothetical protein
VAAEAMKGLILSGGLFVLYVLGTAVVSHVAKFERHSRLFLPATALALPLFVAAYLLSPRDLGFLPPEWCAHRTWLDLLLGLAVFILNIHNYGDWFFGFNGGFSTSMMLLLLSGGAKGTTADELIAEYHDAEGRDKIHGWRIPRLVETGYLALDSATGKYSLTAKGRKLAKVTRLLKRILNLGRGG